MSLKQAMVFLGNGCQLFLKHFRVSAEETAMDNKVVGACNNREVAVVEAQIRMTDRCLNTFCGRREPVGAEFGVHVGRV